MLCDVIVEHRWQTMKIRKTIKTYSELISIPDFEDRIEYLMLSGRVGDQTFGAERYLNQLFYRSTEWRSRRRDILIRDNACDLAHPDHPIYGQVIVHHLNPIEIEDIEDATEYLLNPEYLVCISDLTHRAITYGNKNLIPTDYVPRTPYDTSPWRR